MIKFKIRLIGIVIMLFLQPVLAGESQTRGISEERKSEILEKLSNYKPKYSDRRAVSEETNDDEKWCESYQYRESEYCLEKKYINDGKFVIFVNYHNDLNIPPPPEVERVTVNGKTEYKKEKRETYFNNWRDYILAEILGSNNRSELSPTFMGMSEYSVRIKFELVNPISLEEFIHDPRIFNIESIVTPPLPLEEVVE